MKADVLPESVDVLLPLVQVMLHPGYQAFTNIRLAKAEREVGHFLLVAFQTEDLAHRDHVEVEKILGDDTCIVSNI